MAISRFKSPFVRSIFVFIRNLLIGLLSFLSILLLCYFILYFSVQANIFTNEILSNQLIIMYDFTLENWYYLLTILLAFITIVLAFFEFKNGVKRKQQEKGAEIAKIFSEHLLKKCSILGNVITSSNIYTTLQLDTLDYIDFNHFDRTELFDIYNNDTTIITKIRDFVNDPDTQQIYLKCLENRISLSSYSILNIKHPNQEYTQEDAESLFRFDNSDMPFTFKQLLSSVLNELEYICMYISSQATHSKYVYQSLHQIFLRTVKLLAPIIAESNKEYSDKYYTNIIYVYNNWVEVREDNLKKEKKKKAKMNRLLEPKKWTI